MHSEVWAFMKKQQTITNNYKSIQTSLNSTISLSGNHLIYVRQSDMNRFQPMYVYTIIPYARIYIYYI